MIYDADYPSAKYPSSPDQNKTSMPFYTLPDDVLLVIAEQLENDRDISALCQTSRRSYCSLNTFLYRHNVRRYHSWGMWRAIKLGCEEALLNFIAQGANVQQCERVVKGMNGNENSSESERDPVEGSETLSSSDLTEYSPSSPEEGMGQQEEINAGENDDEEDGDEEDVDNSSEFDSSEYPLNEYHSIEDYSSDDSSNEYDLSENGSSEDDSSGDDYGPSFFGSDSEMKRVLQRTQKERHRYSSCNCYRDEPPVCLAARIGHVGIMKILLVHGVHPNTRNWTFKTPLMIAARYGQTAIVTLLLNTGIISLNAHDDRQQCALSLAAQHGHTEVVKTLLAHPQINPDPCSKYLRRYGLQNCGYREGSPLIQAIQGQHLEIVRLLLNKGVDPRIGDEDNTSALSLAAADGNLEIVRILLDKGAAFDAWGLLDKGPLFEAAEEGHVEVVRLLFERGAADPYLEDDEGQTPLDVAKECGHTAVVDYFEGRI